MQTCSASRVMEKNFSLLAESPSQAVSVSNTLKISVTTPAKVGCEVWNYIININITHQKFRTQMQNYEYKCR